MATDLGKVGMVMKGDYNSISTYEALDVVSYNNGLYVAKQSVPAGTVPTNTTYWQLAIYDRINIGACTIAVTTGANYFDVTSDTPLAGTFPPQMIGSVDFCNFFSVVGFLNNVDTNINVVMNGKYLCINASVANPDGIIIDWISVKQ